MNIEQRIRALKAFEVSRARCARADLDDRDKMIRAAVKDGATSRDIVNVLAEPSHRDSVDAVAKVLGITRAQVYNLRSERTTKPSGGKQ